MAGILEFEKLQQTSNQPIGQQGIIEDSLKNFDTESFKFAKLLLDNDDKNTNPEVMRIFPFFFDREHAITNYGDKDIPVLMDELHIAQLNYKMSVPDFKKSYGDIIVLDSMRPKFFAKIKRSTGGLERERAMLSTQIKQFLTNEMEQAKGGILSRIGSLFGGRK